jgi:pyruvate formate lyase activating enzyme
LGKIQSIQSFSTVDGPGSRAVVFFQGCPMGCVFCHNPDSWAATGGEELEIEVLLRRLERFRPFLRQPGLTLSGGEPLFQPQFALELMERAKRAGWHVALDTSGWGPPETFIRIATAADLVIFSIKHPLSPERLAPHCNSRDISQNWRALARLPIPVWLRYVLIPGWSDQSEALAALAGMARQLPNLERLEVLPFNSLAEEKWHQTGLTSPLFQGTPLRVTEEAVRAAERLIGWQPDGKSK